MELSVTKSHYQLQLEVALKLCIELHDIEGEKFMT